MAARRVLLTTFGSLGDLHPYLAVGRALQGRGYAVRVATLGLYRERVAAAGLEFAPLRASSNEQLTPELIERALHSRTGVQYIVRELVMPSLRTAYQDTLLAADGADLLVTHPLTFATALVAEQRRLPWLSTQLAPIGLASAYDPPVLPGLEWLRRSGAGPGVYRLVLKLADRVTRRWVQPVDALRAELGLTRMSTCGNPLFAGGHSPMGVLALFSPLLGQPQRDWPARVTVTGFPFYVQEMEPNEALEAWLRAGPAPVIFTLGSSAVMNPGEFFRESAAAARRIGMRALLLGVGAQALADPRQVGQQAVAGTAADGGDDVLAVPYASYREVFPRGSAIVHQGGVGTTAEAMRAGRPMVVVPFGVDQPDNAARVERLGVARVLQRKRYRAGRVAAVLEGVLRSGVAARAEAVGRAIREEDGALVAAEAIGRVLGE